MTTDRFPDRLELRGLRYEARHGVHPEEKGRAQPFEVDVVLHADLSAAVAQDSLESTVDYGAVHERVTEVVTGSTFDLIEALAGAIAEAVLAGTDPRLVGGVEVRVRKPKAPIDGAFDTVEVALTRRR